MSWLRLDDGFVEHKKLLLLKRNERWTWLEILSYCARQSNGGVLPGAITNHLKYVTKTFLQKCVDVGLLDVENGYFIVHNWDYYNPQDTTNAVRQQRYRNAKRNAEVTANVTDSNVTNVTPRARASRPVPLEQNPTQTQTPPKEAGSGKGSGRADEMETIGQAAARLDTARRQLASTKAQL